MKSIKISEKSNERVVRLSTKFHMSKQSFVSLVLENITVYEVQVLLSRDILGNDYPVGYKDEEYIYPEVVSEKDIIPAENEDEDLSVEFDDDLMVDKKEIKGL